MTTFQFAEIIFGKTKTFLLLGLVGVLVRAEVGFLRNYLKIEQIWIKTDSLSFIIAYSVEVEKIVVAAALFAARDLIFSRIVFAWKSGSWREKLK